MITAIKPAAVCALALLAGGTVSAADVRDVSQIPGAVEVLQATSESIAPANADALGFQVAQAIGLEPGSNLELKQERSLPNNLGRTLRFVQTYNGIPICGVRNRCCAHTKPGADPGRCP
jgi:hypothetical protein